MYFDHNDKTKALIGRVSEFMDEYIYPNEKTWDEQHEAAEDRWGPVPIVEDLKKKAKKAGLWNLFLPESELGAGLTNLEYAPLSELMGRVTWASEVFNCSAPDTGNMEVLTRYGSPDIQKKYLKPLLAGEMRSAFLMTEPAVASSDATNMEATAVLDGDEWVLNGRKWFSSGAGDRRCKIGIYMCLTNPENARHQQHSQIVVPLDAPGVTIERQLSVFGYDHAPHGHSQILLENVRVPKDNILLGAGRGFEISQARLGPGRIHHCMRSLGMAERALEMMCQRSIDRVAFGKPLHQLGGNVDVIANSRMEIEQARLLVFRAAYLMDTVGNKKASSEIAQIKVVVPTVACNVVDRAIQIFGGEGVTQDTPLASMYAGLRTLRLADGPDEVHRRTVYRQEIGKYK
ncbi:MAG: acyl-CoA dehydrogenase family protein [Cellvibrionaceae bacterium]